MVNIKLMALQIRTYCKPALLVLSFLTIFVLVAIESVFFITASQGEGIIVDYHRLETYTGTENQLVVRYQGLNAIGKFKGGALPKKGSDVRVIYQKSILLGRPHYFFTSAVSER